jgi:hypothetical protein
MATTAMATTKSPAATNIAGLIFPGAFLVSGFFFPAFSF